MKCKDLVIFIIKHDLLDEKINSLKLNQLFLSLEEAAVKMGISTTSLLDMIKLGVFDYIMLDNKIYLHKDVQLTSCKKETV